MTMSINRICWVFLSQEEHKQTPPTFASSVTRFFLPTVLQSPIRSLSIFSPAYSTRTNALLQITQEANPARFGIWRAGQTGSAQNH